jgi:hypothetical protein
MTALSDSQVERYSRQIIVPEVGGRAQERLLASRLLIVGDLSDIEPPLAYMVGAGVGTIHLHARSDQPPADQALARTIAEMAALNPDATVLAVEDLLATAREHPDLTLIVIGSPTALRAAETLARTAWPSPLIFVRLDTPATIALIPKTPPCPACADRALLAPFAARTDDSNAGFVTMVAAVETFNALIGDMTPKPILLKFDGFECRERVVAAPATARCTCSTALGETKRQRDTT